VYIQSCIRAIAASIVNIMAVNKDNIKANNIEIDDATSVAEKSNNSSKCPAVRLLDIRSVVFKDLRNFPNISIPGKNKLKTKGIFQVAMLHKVVYIKIGAKPIE